MENEIISDVNYLTGFNEGYLIAKHMPDLSEKLAGIKTDAPRMEGFRDGRDEFIQEKGKDILPQWLKRDFSKGLSKDKGDLDIEKE